MRNKLAAGFFALFLGGIGIHKFYLGRNVQGILYLIFSWTFIPTIIAFIEAIILFSMSDQKFDILYNSERVLGSRAVMGDLTQLKSLFDQGILTADEYEEKRQVLVDRL
jgi:TM2 domain-containing membrane protein YozV